MHDSEKLASVLADAQVDLNPHQLDAELFAFKSPLPKGSVLADEVGLGKAHFTELDVDFKDVVNIHDMLQA